MQKIFIEAEKRLAASEDLVLVTVVASSGSTPRGAGARMLVAKEGRVYGTVGGGAVEFRAVQLAQNAIEKRASTTKEFMLTKNEVEDLGMTCGGNVTLFFRFLSRNDRYALDLCRTALEQFKGNDTVWLITELTDKADGEIGLFSKKLGLSGNIAAGVERELGWKSRVFDYNGKSYYAEKIMLTGFVYVFGGGHVAQALVPVLSRLDFRCIVFEDRPEFATRELFPDAYEIKITDFHNIAEMAQVTAADYIVALTRGHSFDQLVEEQSLKTPAKYIGVIGSAKKRGAVEESMLSHGFSREDLKRITTPIGLLNIKAETPAEIAISIAGQLIAVRAGAGVVS